MLDKSALYRDTWAEIDLDAIAHNVSLARKLHPHKTLFAVVKANAYGHGDVEVALTALEAGATYLAVSSFEEAMNLRKHGIKSPILIMGATHPKVANLAAEHQITLTAHDEPWLQSVLDKDLASTLKIHLKVDTGMHRIGLRDGKVIEAYWRRLNDHPLIEAEGIYTHMATADGDPHYFREQVARFQAILQLIDPETVKYVHLANSATLLQHDFSFEDGVRLGISMYGIDLGDENLPEWFKLKPTLKLYSRLVQVKLIKKGAKVGYGITYEAKNDEWIGTLSIGYADGWIRTHQGRQVIVAGQECEIIGRICMDQMMIRLPEEMAVGTKATLIGAGMPVERVAAEMGTIPYEIFCLVGDRVPRLYMKKGKVTHIKKMRSD